MIDDNLDDNPFSQFLPRDESAAPDSDPTVPAPVAPEALQPGQMAEPLDKDPTIAGSQAQKHIDDNEARDNARYDAVAAMLGGGHAGARGAADDRSFGRLSPEQQQAWIKQEKADAQSSQGFWAGVQQHVIGGLDGINRAFASAAGLPDDPNAPVDPIVRGLRNKVDSNIALAKRREFLADQMALGNVKPAELTAFAAAGQEVAKGLGDTGVGKMVAGTGRAAEFATDLISGDIEKPQGDEDSSYIVDILNDVVQTGRKGGGAGEVLPRLYGTTLQHLGRWISAKTKEWFPGDEARQFEFGTTLANGAGSMVAFMGPSLAVATLQRATPEALGKLAAYGEFASPSEILAAKALLETQARRGGMATASILGAPMQAESAVQDAEDAQRRGILKPDGTPITEDDLKKTFGLNLLVGATEGLPVGHLLEKAGGENALMAVVRQMAEEGGQEWVQQVGENLTAQHYYDPERKWDDGAWESLAVGAMLGGMMEGGKIGIDKGRAKYNEIKEARLRSRGVTTDVEPGAAPTAAPTGEQRPEGPEVAPAVAVQPPEGKAPAEAKTPVTAFPEEEGGPLGADEDADALAGMNQGEPDAEGQYDLFAAENDPELSDFRDLIGEVPTARETGTSNYVERLADALDTREPAAAARSGTAAAETAQVPEEDSTDSEPGAGAETTGLPEPHRLTEAGPSSVAANIQATRDLAAAARARASVPERLSKLSHKQLTAVYHDVTGMKPAFGSSKVKLAAAIQAANVEDQRFRNRITGANLDLANPGETVESGIHAAIDRATGHDNARNVAPAGANEAAGENAKPTSSPAAPAQGDADVATSDMQDRFRDILRSDLPSKRWAKALGASPAQMKQLIKAGVRQGLLRKGRGGVVRRTPLAKKIGLTPPVAKPAAKTNAADVIGSPENMAAREAKTREFMRSPEWLGGLVANDVFTDQQPGFMSPEWKAARQYNDVDADGRPTGQIIQGFDAMVAHEVARLEAQHPIAREHKAFIIIGFPGAGKSTLAGPLSREAQAVEVSPDPLKRNIPEYDGGANARGVHDESSYLAKAVLREMMNRGNNVVLEKLGSTEASVTKPAKDMQAAGYHVAIVLVDVPKAVAMERAINRFKDTGRVIEESTYDANIPGVFGALKNEGTADEFSHFEWQEPQGWRFLERSPSLQPLHIPAVDGAQGLGSVDGRHLDGGDQPSRPGGEGGSGEGGRLAPPKSEAALADLLQSYGINTALYGQGEAKTIANLLKELKEGESALYVEDGRLVRRLETLGINVTTRTADGQLLRLKEDRQEFRDGRMRRRELATSLGEKLKAGEVPETSIGRALEEELGITQFAQQGGITQRVSSIVSQSFPGLPTENTIHVVNVTIPPSAFRPEYQEVQAEKTNYFNWAPVNDGGLTMPPEVRVDRLIQQREDATGRTFPGFLYDYATRLEAARGDNAAFAPVLAEVRADTRLTKPMIHDLAAIVGAVPTTKTTKAEALDSIESRHTLLTQTKEAVDANSSGLGEGEGRILEERLPGEVQEDEGGRPSESAPGASRPGSAGDVRDDAGASDGIIGPAEDVRGAGGAPGGPAGATAGSGESRVHPRQALSAEQQAELAEEIASEAAALEQTRQDRTARNYKITPEDKIGQGGAKAKVRANIAAIELLKKIEDEGRVATDDEKKVLVKYTGWGAFSQPMFADYNVEFAKERAQLKNLLTPAEYASARASTINAHYTSPDVITGMWEALAHLGFTGGRVLEPAAGIGHFIGLQPEAMRPDSAWTAVELDSLSGRITKQLYGAADVRVGGFEAQVWPNDHFDLAISNVPFAKEGPYDPAYKTQFSLHDYFFVKALDKVRPGGIVAFITSSHTLDKARDGARLEMEKRGTFLGAIRLPGGNKGAFKANAGTDVTTDIIFFRKKMQGETALNPEWRETSEIKTPEGPTKINSYFAEHPDMMLGKMRLLGTMYRDGEPVLIGPTEHLDTAITEAAAKLPADAFVTRGTTLTELEPEIDTEASGIKEGAFYLKDDKVYRKVVGVGVPQKLNKTDEARVRAFLPVRDVVNDLLSAQAGGTGVDMTERRAALNTAYDAFVHEFGPINKADIKTITRKDGKVITSKRKPNFAAFEDDLDAYKVAAIENYDEKTGAATKAAIFNEDIVAPYVRPEVSGPSDALAVSLNETGKVDIKLIADALGTSERRAIEDLGDGIYLNPNGEQWQTAGQYLSGDVVEKLEQAKAAALNNPKYNRNVTALENVQPIPLTRNEITLPFGASYLPKDVIEDFLNETLETRGAIVDLNPVTFGWSVRSLGHYNPAMGAAWGTPAVEVKEIVEAALNSKAIEVKWKDRDGNTHRDLEAESLARAKVTQLQEAFTGQIYQGAPAAIGGWVWNEEERAQRLEALYNAAMNRLVKETHDGSHLTFPGLARVVTGADGSTFKINLPAARTGAIWRIIQNGNTLIDHVVGAGKTWTSIMAVMEMKRLGQVRRPMFVVPNHMLMQFSKEFLQAYPAAKLLVATKDNMSRERRAEFAAKAAAEKWDGIIITHSAFGRLKMQDAAYKAYYEDAMAEMEAAKAGEDDNTVKDIEKARKRIQKKLDTLTKKQAKDQGITFEELGVDHLTVDEAHLFKNLWFMTRHTRVKGISNSSESQRATDLFIKIRHLEKSRPGRSVNFLTGTPLSNTMAEVYTMMRYLQYDTLQKWGVGTFDSWAQTFGLISASTKLAPNGRDFRDEERFDKFVNIPELSALYARIADTQTADSLGLVRPKIKGGAPKVIASDLNEMEESLVQSIIHEMEAMKGKKPEKGQPNFLSMFTKGLQLSTDIRLVDPNAEFNPDGKIANAVAEIARIYQEGNADPNAPNKSQIVFLDMGVPGSRAKVAAPGLGALKPASLEEWQAAMGEPIDKIRKGLSDTEAVADEDSAIDDSNEDGDAAEMQPEVSEEDAELEAMLIGKFNLYEDMKNRLIEQGVPAHEIAFIHDAKTDAQKEKLFEAVRNGQVRVLIGSTGKMGVGTNVQKRLVALHHIDAPWKPADLEQRDGRIERQGNMNDEVQIYRYITKRSFESYRWQVLEAKANFIAQFRAGARGLRIAEDIDSPLPDAGEIKAAATGDHRIIEAADLDRTVRGLLAQASAHAGVAVRARQSLASIQKNLERQHKWSGIYEQDAAHVDDLSGDNFKIAVHLPNGQMKSFDKRKEAGEALRKYLLTLAEHSYYGRKIDVEFGRISGFEMTGTLKKGPDGLEFSPAIKGATSYDNDDSYFVQSDTNPMALIGAYTRLVAKVPGYAQSVRANIEDNERQIPLLEKKTQATPFPKQAELEEKQKRLAALMAALKPQEAKVGEAPMPDEAARSNAPPDVPGAPVVAIPGDADGLMASLIAYHGSRHDFEKFSASKIDSGEGAQAYGHGLYFAENPGVARSYRQAGAEHRDYNQGTFYQVRLDVEPDHLIDWDKPYAQQSPFIQKALADNLEDSLSFIRPSISSPLPLLTPSRMTEGYLPGYGVIGPYFFKFSVQREIKKLLNDPEHRATYEREVKRQIEQEPLSSLLDLGRPEIAKKMLSLGIQGIRYFDNFSRRHGAGTSNYVIFDDNKIAITHKDGAPVASAEREVVMASLVGRQAPARAAPAVQFTPLFREKASQVAAEVEDQLRQALPRDIAGQVVDQLFLHGNDAAGITDFANRMVSIALSQGDTIAFETAKHEVVHALRGDPGQKFLRSLYTPREWQTLVDRAKKTLVGRDMRLGDGEWAVPLYRETYRGKSEAFIREVLDQELVAKMAETWGDGASYGNAIDKLFYRIKTVLDAILRAFNALGFNTPTDVFGTETDAAFRKSFSGEVGARARPALPAPDSLEARKARAQAQGFDTSKVWYHGTDKGFDSFSPDKLGSNTEAPSAAGGFFFTDRPATANYYAQGKESSLASASQQAASTRADAKRNAKFYDQKGDAAAADRERQRGREAAGPNVMPVYLRITNPLIHDFKGKTFRDVGYNDLIAQAKRDGHDAVIMQNTYDAGEHSRLDAALHGRFKPETITVVFDPANIRSVNAQFAPEQSQSDQLMASLIGQRGAENLAKTNPAAKEALTIAQEMDRHGAIPDQIWDATTAYLESNDKSGTLVGVYMGVDGQWRIEVDDSKVNPTLHAEGSNVGTVPEMLPHPTLEAAHPDLENASAVLHLDSKRYRPPSGHATGENFMRATGSTPEDIASVGMHEYQHLLQDREGFAQGSNPNTSGKRYLPEIQLINDVKRLVSLVAPGRSLDEVVQILDGIVGSDERGRGGRKITEAMLELARDPAALQQFEQSIPSAYEAYRREAGEVEARMVQKRLDMTAEERREHPPYDDYDVPDWMQTESYHDDARASVAPDEMAPKIEGTTASHVRTPTQSQDVESLSRIIADLKKALGMTATQGRYGMSLTDQSPGAENNRPPKTWRFKPQKSLRGQYHRRVGAARYKLSTDIEAIAHEGGHHLESMLGQPLGALKRQFADELRSYAYRSFAPAAQNSPAPQLQGGQGYSGLNLDAEAQRLLVEAVAADGQAIATGTPEAKARDQRLRAELDYRLGESTANAAFMDAYKHAQAQRSLADLPQYVQARFSESGVPTPAAQDQRASLSEGFAEFFREYITHPDQAKKFAPEFYAAFEDLLDAVAPQLLQNIERAQLVTTSKAYDNYLRATTLDRARADLKSEANQSWYARTRDTGILRGLDQADTISGAVYRIYSDAMGYLSGAASQLYRMLVDEAHPFYVGTKRLLEQADQSGLTDDQGRAVSLAVHQNPYKLMRSIGDSFKTGLRWIQDGVPNYRQQGGSRSASLHDALALVMGKSWNLAAYQDFGVYLESRRAVEEWKAWTLKRQTLATLGGKMQVAAAQNKVLRATLAKEQAKLERRTKANTGSDAVLKEYHARLQALITQEAQEVRDLQEGQVATPGMTPQQERNAKLRLRDLRERIAAYEARYQELQQRRHAAGAEGSVAGARAAQLQQAIAKREAIIARSRAERDRLTSGGLQRAPHRVSQAEHEARIAELEKMHPNLPQAAGMVYDFLWRSAIHDFQAGRLTKAELDYRATRRHFYVPFARDLSDVLDQREGFSGKGVQKFAKDKTFEGSDRAIVNPIETIIDQTFHRAAATHFNDVMKAFINLADAVGTGAADVAERVEQSQLLDADTAGFKTLENRLVSLGYNADDAREMVKRIESDFGDTQLLLKWSPEHFGPNRPLLLPLWENGERKLIRLNDPEWAGLVYNSVNGLGRELSSVILDVVSAPASILRYSITTNPAFILPNILRDMMSAFILTGRVLDPRTWPIVTQLRGLYHELAQTDMARLYQEVGGLMGGQNVAALSKVRDKADVLALKDRGLHLHPMRLGFASVVGGAAGFATLGPAGVPFGAMLGAGFSNGFKRFFETMAHFSDLSETATRMGTFTQAYKAALSYNPSLSPYQAAQEAAYVARDLIDFGRRGANMLIAARLVPFLNANVQGLDKAVRALLARSDRGFSLHAGKLSAAGALGAVAGYAGAGAAAGATAAFAVPAAAVALATRSEAVRRLLAPAAKHVAQLPMSADEARILGESAKAWTNLLFYTGLLVAMASVSGGGDPDEYKMISDRVKNRAQPVKLGGDWYQIPKAFEFGVPANIIQAGISLQFDKDPRFWERVRSNLADNIAPPGLPQAVKLWSDIRGNYNSLTGAAIVPDWQKKLPPQDQFNAYTSAMAISLAKTINENPMLKAAAETAGGALFASPNFEVSPAIIDYALSTGGGYWGKDVQKASNLLTGAPTGPLSGRAAEMPIIGTVLQRVSVDPYRANDALQSYYDTMSTGSQAFERAATGYDFVLTNQGQGPANAVLATMDDDHRAYALLMATSDSAAKRSHPLNRLKDVLGSLRSLEQELATGTLADTSAKQDPQPIPLSPAKTNEIRDTLAKIKALEAWNTMVDMGTAQFANRTQIDIKPTMALLKAQSPEVAEELQRRYDRKHVLDLEEANDLWQENKADLLQTWAELAPTNEPMPNPKKRRGVVKLKRPAFLGGPAPNPLNIDASADQDEPNLGPEPTVDPRGPADAEMISPTPPANSNMREIAPAMPNNLGPEMQPRADDPNNMDEQRWQEKLM